jgi:hypothetical protein
MPSIAGFRSALQRHGNVGRQYRWRVNLAFPAAVTSSTQTQDASILAISTQTPKFTLGEVMLPWGGREFPEPGDRKWEPFPLTFLGVEDDFHHSLFEAWQEQFNGSQSNTAADEFVNLFQDVELELLDKNDAVVKTYRLQDAWPQEVGELTLDQTAQDSYSQFTVTLRYFNCQGATAR